MPCRQSLARRFKYRGTAQPHFIRFLLHPTLKSEQARSDLSSNARIHVVLGTAGHIDHGKTTLVRALTGCDTDRLPEEKKRGITIVLGFAPLDLPNGTRVGVIDVPGHERFVKNMVAGAAGIDLVLLVVAADEGVMPQTREHVEICQLLGVRHGIVALTKIDRADPDLIDLAVEDVRDFLDGTTLQDAAIIKCSSTTGEGIDELKTEVIRQVEQCARDNNEHAPVLPIDRLFSVKGFGSVVTGTLLSGSLAAGDEVVIMPAISGRPPPSSVKIRSIQVFHESVDRAFSGDRTALSLPGVDLEQLSRGQVIVPPGLCQPTRSLDVRFNYLASRSKALKSGAKGIFHLGSAIVNAQLTLLNADRLQPGEEAFARIRLQEPVAALQGQRFILRGFEAVSNAGRTIGGGVVLDPDPPKRKRHTAQTESVLEALELAIQDPKHFHAGLVAIVQEHGLRGLKLTSLGLRLAKTPRQIENAVDKAVKSKALLKIQDRCVSSEALQGLNASIFELIDQFHREHPFKAGISLNELSSRIGKRVPSSFIERAAKSLVGMKKLAHQSEGYHRLDHRPFGAAGGAAKKTVMATLTAARLAPPSLAQLQAQAMIDAKSLREMLATLVKTEEVIRVTPALYFESNAFFGFQQQVLEFLKSEGGITTAQAKTLTGLSRKYLIPLLECLDKRRVTVRVGEVRKAL